MPGHGRVYAGNEEDFPRFIEAVHWILRNGAHWREPPEHFGKWNSVLKRCARWQEHGVWAALFHHCAQDPDMAAVLPDSTVVRACMSAAGGSANGGAGESSFQVVAVADSVAKCSVGYPANPQIPKTLIRTTITPKS